MIVKTFLFFAGLFCAFALSSNSSVSSATTTAKLQRAEASFSSPVQLMGATLQGDYIFVHNDEASGRGEACTFVYKNSEKPKNLVTSFHCTTALRSKVAHFTVRSAPNEMGQLEVTEFQFPDSSVAHLLPAYLHDGHVSIVPIK
jgi:hypothetical protein